jgi:ribosome biogenesis protein YTM1
VVKLFDTRSPRRALFSLSRPQGAATAGASIGGSKEKLLASAWDCEGQVVLAGGEDCKVNVFRGEGIGIERPGFL